MAIALTSDQLTRWRLILGKDSKNACPACAEGCSLSAEQLEMDEALEAIYSSESDEEISRDEWESSAEGRKHGAVKGRSFPRVARWLDQIRNFFPSDCVVLLQKDAIERRGMKELLFELESGQDRAIDRPREESLSPRTWYRKKPRQPHANSSGKSSKNFESDWNRSSPKPFAEHWTVTVTAPFAACQTSIGNERSVATSRTTMPSSKRSFLSTPISSAASSGKRNGT